MSDGFFRPQIKLRVLLEDAMSAKDMKGSEILEWLDSMSKAEQAEARKIGAELQALQGNGPLETWMFVRTVMELRRRGAKTDVERLQAEALLEGLFVLRDKYKLPNAYKAPAQNPKPVRGL
jgi:hypothetical protein